MQCSYSLLPDMARRKRVAPYIRACCVSCESLSYDARRCTDL